MQETGIKSLVQGLEAIGLRSSGTAHWNLDPAALVEQAILRGEGHLTDTGALMADTGKFTGRSPEDKYWVKDAHTADTIWWGDVNHAIAPEYFAGLKSKMLAFLSNKDFYVRDVYACADPEYQISIRVITTKAYHNLFVNNMFLRPTRSQLETFSPEYTILCVPEFEADPAVDGTRNKNFAVLNLSEKFVLIGGTGYTGEIKKGVFSILNYVLPHEHKVLSMHCSANSGEAGDVSVFFGLSGTGKTTLSADPNRKLIGDDEHGWTPNSVFNFEGGCYAKVINISRENEPEIWDAIKFGAVLENTRFLPDTRTVDYTNKSVTENTRVSYPIHHIPNAAEPSVGGIPTNIFFLTADAYGVLPPISKLNAGQAMFHFISGYTSKVAGTEVGVTEPKMVFSACFGAPFLPLHPATYAELLGQKMKEHNVNVWLVSTGWSGGAYGVGSRIKLRYTRAMITAALNGSLNQAEYREHPVFGVMMPTSCPGVPTEILNPQDTWADKEAYNAKADFVAQAFLKNFQKYAALATDEIIAGAPKPMAVAG